MTGVNRAVVEHFNSMLEYTQQLHHPLTLRFTCSSTPIFNFMILCETLILSYACFMFTNTHTILSETVHMSRCVTHESNHCKSHYTLLLSPS